MSSKALKVENLRVVVEDKTIIKGLNLNVESGKVHALMGPNGSGKSTLAFALAGHPRYNIATGKILIDGKNITHDSPDKRSLKGLFLAFQYPSSITGVPLGQFLRIALNHKREAAGQKPLSPKKFKAHIEPLLEKLKVNHEFLERYLNEGFSGGEKKKAEILQLLTLEPKYAILDETDSGLDIDALKIVSNGVNVLFEQKNPPGVLLITHYQRILNYIKPDKVHVMINGKIAKTGKAELVELLEKEGYRSFQP